MPTRISAAPILVAVLAVLLAPGAAGAADADVQRQIQQREQQQTELRLKMQQQRERAAHPPASPVADLRLRQLERDQQQRLQQLHEQQSRAATVPNVTGESLSGAQRQRELQGGSDALRHYDAEPTAPR